MELRGAFVVVAGRPAIFLTGVIDVSTLPALHDLVLRATLEHLGAVLAVDLDGVDVIDDAGLGVLLGAAARARHSGGDLVVIASRPAVVERFAATGFDRAVEVVPVLSEVHS